jgi:hypothetical protein
VAIWSRRTSVPGWYVPKPLPVLISHQVMQSIAPACVLWPSTSAQRALGMESGHAEVAA